MDGLAYVLTQAGRPLVAERRSWPHPAPGETLVEVIGCGLCHTDLGYARGEVPTKKPVPLGVTDFCPTCCLLRDTKALLNTPIMLRNRFCCSASVSFGLASSVCLTLLTVREI